MATVMTTMADLGSGEMWMSPGGPEGGPFQAFSFQDGLRSASRPNGHPAPRSVSTPQQSSGLDGQP
jgi:hypothetical protein